jgi:hypothetical protein
MWTVQAVSTFTPCDLSPDSAKRPKKTENRLFRAFFSLYHPNRHEGCREERVWLGNSWVHAFGGRKTAVFFCCPRSDDLFSRRAKQLESAWGMRHTCCTSEYSVDLERVGRTIRRSEPMDDEEAAT